MSKKSIILLIIAGFLIATVVIVWLKIPTPFTPALTAFFTAITTLNFDKITTAFWALIGSLGALAGVAGAAIYALIKKGKALIQEQIAHAQTKSAATSYINQLTGTNQAQETALQTKENALTKLSTEKEQLTTQYGNAQSELDSVKSQLTEANATKKELMDQLTNTPVKIVERTV